MHIVILSVRIVSIYLLFLEILSYYNNNEICTIFCQIFLIFIIIFKTSLLSKILVTIKNHIMLWINGVVLT